jgi:hypothetical protein
MYNFRYHGDCMSKEIENNRSRRKQKSEKREKAIPQRRDYSPPPLPKRQYAPDPITGKPIENILTAIMQRDSKEPINFDTALDQVKNSEHLGPNDIVCYIGSGNFAVYTEHNTNGRKYMELKKKIAYEDNHEKPVWRRELSPGISRDYVPTPQNLSELYTQEELMNFPRMGSGSGIYLPKNS